MAYLIQCHIVEPDEARIRMVVSFFGTDQDDAQDAYDTYFDQNINLGKIDKEERLVIEEDTIPDDELPEVEEEEEEEQETT
jgi:hypothetical protein